jgi:hypothetical protein
MLLPLHMYHDPTDLVPRNPSNQREIGRGNAQCHCGRGLGVRAREWHHTPDTYQ